MADTNKWRVMVVDDDQPFLNSLMEMLGTEYETVGAVNGLDALEKVDRCEPDLIILDIAMPCVDGIDTCRAIRKNARFRQLPVVFISGLDETTYADRLKGAGAARFLRKPFTPEELLRCCRELLQGSGATSQPSKRYSVVELESGYPGTAEGSPGSPTASTQAASRARTGTAELPPGSAIADALPIRVMVVDDSSETISLMLNALRDRYEVFGVHDPISAICKIIRYQPDLLILNVAMPRMSGYQLSQLLRLNKNLRTIKILFVLSRSSTEEIAYAQKLGAADYLVKPLRAEELLEKVTAITDEPGFVVREKALSFQDIQRAESTDPVPSQFF